MFVTGDRRADIGGAVAQALLHQFPDGGGHHHRQGQQGARPILQSARAQLGERVREPAQGPGRKVRQIPGNRLGTRIKRHQPLVAAWLNIAHAGVMAVMAVHITSAREGLLIAAAVFGAIGAALILLSRTKELAERTSGGA